MLLLLTLLSAHAVDLQPSTGASLCFPSGLRVSYSTRSTRPLVGVTSVYEGGSSTEQAPGVAHLVEHLWFRSKPLYDQPVGELLAEFGAEANAFTSHDDTRYLTVAPLRAVRALIDLEVARLRDPLVGIDDATFASERQVVQQELGYRGTVPSLSQRLFERLVGPDHPYAASVGGTPEQVGALTLHDARTYASEHYRVDQASLVVEADLPADKGWRLLLSALPDDLLVAPGSDRTTPTNCTDRPTEEAPRLADTGPHFPEVEAAVEEPLLVVGWWLPPGEKIRSNATVAAGLVRNNLWDHRTLAETDCWVSARRRANLLLCALPLPEGSDPASQQKAFGKAAHKIWLQASTPGHKLAYSWHWWAAQGRIDQYTAILDRRERLDTSPEGWLALTGTSLHVEGHAVPNMPYKGVDGAARGPAEVWLDYASLDKGRAVIAVPASEEEEQAPGALDHAGRAVPSATARTDLARLYDFLHGPYTDGMLTRYLENGVQITVLPHAGVARTVVSARLTEPLDPWSSEGTLYWVQTLLQGVSFEQRRPRLEDGMNASFEVDGDTWRWHLAHGTTSAQLFIAKEALVGTLPIRDAKDVAEDLAELQEWREQHVTEPEFLTATAHWKATVGDSAPHPYYDDAGFERIVAVDRSVAQSHLRRILRPEHLEVVVLTPEEPASVMERAVTTFEAFYPLKSGGEVPRWDAPTVLAEVSPDVRVIDAGKVGRAVLQLSCPAAEDAVAGWLGEVLVEAELTRSLRQDMAATYHVGVSYAEDFAGDEVRIRTEVPARDAGKVLAAIRAVLARTTRGEIGEDELSRIKLRAASRTALYWQSGADRADAALAHPEPDAPPLADRMHDMTAEQLGSSFAGCVDRPVVTVSGNALPIEQALDEAGIPHVRVDPPTELSLQGLGAQTAP